MRATVGSLAVLIVFALTTTPFAAEQTWTGKIGDSACNLKHEHFRRLQRRLAIHPEVFRFGARAASEPDVVARIRAVQGCLADVRGLELHAPHFFHISLQTCGFSNELPFDRDRLRDAVAAVPSFEVALGGVNAFHSAVFLETHSGGGCCGCATLFAVRSAPSSCR